MLRSTISLDDDARAGRATFLPFFRLSVDAFADPQDDRVVTKSSVLKKAACLLKSN
jgi:hypothetical protein